VESVSARDNEVTLRTATHDAVAGLGITTLSTTS